VPLDERFKALAALDGLARVIDGHVAVVLMCLRTHGIADGIEQTPVWW